MNQKRKAEAETPANSTELNKDIGEEREARERGLDETIAETFPASDPLSSDPNPAPNAEENVEEKDKLAS